MSFDGKQADLIKKENRETLERAARDKGIHLFGIALLDPVRNYFHPSIINTAAPLQFGISMGVRLSDEIIDGINNEPTLIYKHHYSTVNHLLDQAAVQVAGLIQSALGGKALAIPASQIVDWEKQEGHLTHKSIAYQAGLGWIGRSNLIVNPEFGARTRYVTILTDLSLEPDKPIERNCGNCCNCIEACPAGAITRENYDRDKCIAKLKEFAKKSGIGQYICGVCVKACPGRKSY
jgi:epoxyqueuosine reductase